MVKRAIAGHERDYLLEYRAATSSTSPPTRSTRCATTPAASHPPSAASTARTGRRPSRRCARRSPRSPRSSSCSTRPGSTAPASPSARTRPGSGRWRTPSPSGDARPARRHRLRQGEDMEEQVPMDRLVCGDVGFGKTEVAIRPCSRRCRTARAAVLVPTTLLPPALPDVLGAVRRLSVRVEGAQPLPDQRRRGRGRRARGRRGRRGHRHHRLLSGTSASRSSACWWSTRAALRVTKGGHEEAEVRHDVDVLTLTATPIPRTLEMSLTGIRDHAAQPRRRAPAHPHLRRRVRRAGGVRGHPPGALRDGQVFFVHNRVKGHRGGGGVAARPRARGPGGGGPRPDGRGHPRAGRHRLLGGRFDVPCARRSSSRASTCRR